MHPISGTHINVERTDFIKCVLTNTHTYTIIINKINFRKMLDHFRAIFLVGNKLFAIKVKTQQQQREVKLICDPRFLVFSCTSFVSTQ